MTVHSSGTVLHTIYKYTKLQRPDTFLSRQITAEVSLQLAHFILNKWRIVAY